jgi:Ca-activated chloride channel family protein
MPIIVPVPEPIKPILTQQHHADIRIKDQVASITVNAEFYNPNPQRMEGTYFFPLEENASVSGFSMVINGKETQAELLPAEKARNIYEDIVRRQKDPGLLEYVGTKMLKARVFPIEPNSAVKVKLQYEQTIREEGGLCHLRYPLRSAKPNEGTVNQVTVSVSIESGIALKSVYSPSHTVDVARNKETAAKMSYEASNSVPDRDFDVYFARAGGDLGLSLLSHKPPKEDGYFLLSLSPKVETPAGEVQKKNMVFVVDTSGSMLDGGKIEQARKALSFCVNSLNPGDRFNIIGFSTEARPFKDALMDFNKDTLEEARGFIEKITARGGTAIEEALNIALGMAAKEQGLTMLVFLTDGKPTIGEQNVDRLLEGARKLNTSKCRIFVFGVGYDVNTDLLDKLAEGSRGTKEYVVEKEDIEVKVSNLYTKIANPVLADTKLGFEGVQIYDMYPKELPDVFRGSQIMVFGRYKDAGKRTVKVSGVASNKSHELQYPVEFGEKETNEFLPRVWATRKVAYLLNEIRLRGKNQELVDEVVALGKQYGIVTPYTSFLVVEEGMSAPVRNEIAAAKQALEEAVDGKEGVLMSRGVGRMKGADAAGAPAAAGFGGGEKADVVDRLVQQKIHHIADKTFIARPDGFLYDTLYQDEDKAKAVEIEFLSDPYFELVRKHPVLGRYFAGGKNMVVCFEGKVYRIKAQ